jgi:hypothetical protein
MWWRRKRNAELNREIESHLDLEAEEQNGDRHAARKAFGNATLVKEDTRAAWGRTMLERLAQDVRYAVRCLRKKPAFTVVAIASLALGIGANTAIFAVVNGVLLRPLPYPEPERLVRLWETLPKRNITANVVNAWNFLDWRERTSSFEAIAAMQALSANLTGQGEPVSVRAIQVSTTFFSILGVQPLIGRGFLPDDERPGPDRGVVLSHNLWQSRFSGDPALIGTSIAVNGAPATVVGVMPADFSFPGALADLWIPLPIQRSPLWERGRSLSTVARLKKRRDARTGRRRDGASGPPER